MKIGFMANYFYPATGGMEELTFGIAKELAKKGHEVYSLSSGLTYNFAVGIYIKRTEDYEATVNYEVINIAKPEIE